MYHLVFSIHLFAVDLCSFVIHYSIFYLILILKWQGCLMESLWLIFKKSDTVSLTQLHNF